MAKKNISNLTVGYGKLPGRAAEGSAAYYNKQFTESARASMAGIIQRFQEVINNIKGATIESLEEAMTPTFDKAQLYCPKKTGALVESGEMILGTNADDSAYCRIASGGGGTIPYAAIVHERTDLHHEPPTRSKYLQSAVEEDLGNIKSRFVRDMRIRIGFD